ncbi:MAG: aryl-sulfate sulfotransferase [bacterium]|nr:aryl-sulfate sulfotransferase [bacterium]
MKIQIRELLLTGALFCFLPTLAQKWSGLTLYSVSNANTALLVDTNNVTVKTWSGLSGGTGYSSYLEPGGTLVRSVTVPNTTFMGGGACGRIQKVNYSGAITWDFTYSSNTYYTHHDHCVLPNGNVLLISYELKTNAELAAAGGTANLASMWPDKIIEVQPTGASTGSIVWEWHSWDHLVQNVDPLKANYQSSIVNHPELLNINYVPSKDWLHCNGLDYNPMLDQITLSSHFMNEFYVLDHSTTSAQAASHTGGNAGKGGDFLYRWGNPAAYQAAGTKIFNVVHDAHWIPEGHPNAGRLVGFNNQGVSLTASSIDQIMPPRNNYNYTITPGAGYQPSSYLQRLSGFGYSSNEGNSEQYPNGNQLVCVAIAGKIYELNPTGTPIFTITTGSKTAQAHRYSTCYINNPAPVQPSISATGSDLVSTSASTYQWYYNGNLMPAATSQNFTPIGNGMYVVRTTDANGCVYVYSAAYSYVNTNSIEELVEESVSIYPNPSHDVVDLNFNYLNHSFVLVKVYDATGKYWLQFENRSRLDLSELPEGIYVLNITIDQHHPVNRKVLIVGD